MSAAKELLIRVTSNEKFKSYELTPVNDSEKKQKLCERLALALAGITEDENQLSNLPEERLELAKLDKSLDDEKSFMRKILPKDTSTPNLHQELSLVLKNISTPTRWLGFANSVSESVEAAIKNIKTKLYQNADRKRDAEKNALKEQLNDYKNKYLGIKNKLSAAIDQLDKELAGMVFNRKLKNEKKTALENLKQLLDLQSSDEKVIKQAVTSYKEKLEELKNNKVITKGFFSSRTKTLLEQLRKQEEPSETDEKPKPS